MNLTLVEGELVFSTDEAIIHALRAPSGWSPMIDDEHPYLFFEVVDYTNGLFHLVVDNEDLVGEVLMFVLFDKGVMQGKIRIVYDYECEKHVLSPIGDWTEKSFIPQETTQWADAPMIEKSRVAYRFDEGPDEENQYSVAVLVVWEDKFVIFYTKLVFYQGTAKIEVKQIELQFPIQSFGHSITSEISFTTNDRSGYYCQYFTDFTIKIGEINYYVCMSFGEFNNYSVDHRDGHYTLSAIYNKETCTTIFCGNEDAVERMDRGMTRRGIFSIKIPEFVALETDEYEYSELFDSLTHLPDDLQAFLRSITWCNPDA
jgi:hypothetical protein